MNTMFQDVAFWRDILFSIKRYYHDFRPLEIVVFNELYNRAVLLEQMNVWMHNHASGDDQKK